MTCYTLITKKPSYIPLTFDPLDFDAVECLKVEVSNFAIPRDEMPSLVWWPKLILAITYIAINREAGKTVNS